jgi:PAS domain S-box-containing protein
MLKPLSKMSNFFLRRSSVFNRHIVLGLLAFLFLAILFGSLIYQRYLIIKQEQKKEAFVMANNTRDRLREVLANSLSATRILAFFIDNDGIVKNFDSVAAQVLSTNKHIDALELVPDGVIRQVYPARGNEGIIGYNVLKDPTRNKEAFKAIQKNELFFSGPYALKQGGFGIVGRLPVFRNGKFWGFSAVVIKISTLLKATGLSRVGTDGYYYQLSKINPDTKNREYFIPHVKEPLHDYLFSVEIPDGEWKLSVEPVDNNKGNTEILILALLGFLFSVVGGVFVYILVKRPEKLDMLVKERTSQLKESEENYKVLFEKSPLPLWIYDLDTFKILEVNDAAINLYGYSREEFLQMNMLGIRHEQDVEDFLELNRNNTEELRHIGVKTHIKKNKEEVQVLIFSRNITYGGRPGRLVLLMDVSEKIKVEEELIRSEEKYRSLIEQASDGIILYSFDGTIHSFNKAAYTQTGYTEEEFAKLNLKDLLFEKRVDRNRSKNNKLKPDQATTLYRRLKRKDDSVFLVELNARLLPDGKIIAIVRDITEREKAEQARIHEEETRQLIMNSALDAIICIDAAGIITLWNPEAEKIFGWSEAEIKGRLLSTTIIPEQYRERHEMGMKHYLQTGQGPVLNKMFEITALDRKGREFPIELSIVPMTQDGQQSFCAFIRDITERRKATEEINKSNERFDLIAQATNDAVWDHDFIKNETWGNKELYRLYGFEYGKEKIDLELFLSHLHPDDRPGLEQRMNDAMEQSVSSLSETFRFKTADGTYKNFYDRAHIKYDSGGKPVRILGAMHDITDREMIKQQILKEKELSDGVINSLPGVFYLVRKGGKFLRWNKNIETVTGYTAEEISGMHPLDFFDKADQPLMMAKIASVFAVGSDEVEIDFLLKNKQKIPYYFTGQAIEYEGEICLMGVGLDFSEREKAGKALRESKELLQRSYEDIRQLASNLQGIREDERTNISREIHDELGQQLTGLKMDLHWLNRKINSADEEVAAKMKESIELINATITSVRKIATDLRPSILDDLGLIAALEWQGEEFKKRSGTDVEFINKVGDISLEPRAVTAIFRIYQELLTNIARHANAGLVTTTLKKQGSNLYFSISDNGAGFNPETISKKRTLGLLGIKERTLLLGGTYEFKSTPGKGTEAVISIPITEK